MGVCSLPSLAVLLSLLTCVLARPCDVDDVGAVYSPCTNGQRFVAYYWLDASCDGVPPFDSFATVNCTCTHWDYRTERLPCNMTDATSELHYSLPSDADCTEVQPAPSPVFGLPCICDESMISGFYSECKDDNTRDLRYFYTISCVDGVPLPASRTGLGCASGCSEGQYLPLGADVCQTCSNGTYSHGQAQLYHFWGDQWPAGFSTTCETTAWFSDTCRSTAVWQRQGAVVSSGDLSGIHSVNVQLRYDFTLVEDGGIGFEYMVDAENPHDGLRVAVDTLELLKDSRAHDWTSAWVPLPAGQHSVIWTYKKDSLYERGLDRCDLRDIRVVGVEVPLDKCFECPAGFYSGSGAARCLPCPRNTFSGARAAACTPCTADSYAPPASSTCQPRAPCTEDDYLDSYTDCHADGASFSREVTYQWEAPVICNPATGVSLPATRQGVKCLPCHPGYNRDPATGQCVPCPLGQYSAANMTGCEVCPAGTAAVQELWLTDFHERWPANMTTYDAAGAHPDADVSGWRLNGENLETNAAGVVEADRYLRLDVVLDQPGELAFQLSGRFANSIYSYMIVRVDDSILLDTSDNVDFAWYRFPISEPGQHTIIWEFHKWYLTDVRDDYAKIHEIRVTGVVHGGAGECKPCAAGHISSAAAEVCTPCPAGTTTNGAGVNATQCFACPDDYYAEAPGSSECTPCPPGTQGTRDHASCEQACQLEVQPGVVYDLEVLFPSDAMVGPIVEPPPQQHQYWINACHPGVSNTTCRDSSGGVLTDVRACQLSTDGLAIYDVGRMLSMEPLQASNPHAGLLVTLLNGHAAGCETDRKTLLELVCDPDAGADATIVAHPDGVERAGEACRYHFLWRTPKACPRCTSKDIAFSWSDCDAATSTRTKLFHWIDNPRHCFGGVSLPPSDPGHPCSTDVVYCGPGQVLDDAQDSGCSDCAPGTASPGGVTVLQHWDAVPTAMDSPCAFSPSGWSVREPGVLVASATDASVTCRLDFLVAGAGKAEAEVMFSVLGASPSTRLDITLDDQALAVNMADAALGWASVSGVVTQPGNHTLSIVFAADEDLVDDDPAADKAMLLLHHLRFLGTSRAADVCTVCPRGFFTQIPGAAECIACPAGLTTLTAGATTCSHACDSVDGFSFEGDSACRPRHACAVAVDAQHYTDDTCITEQTGTWAWLRVQDQQVCQDGEPLPSDDEPVPCNPCAPGTTRNQDTGVCEACAAGTHRGLQDSACSACDTGIAAGAATFTSFTTPTWPEAWTTTVDSAGSSGWRRRGDHMDSGVHYRPGSRSFLSYQVNVRDRGAAGSSAGSVTFQYSVTKSSSTDAGAVRFDFLINGRTVAAFPPVEASEVGTATLPLPAGQHTLTWVFTAEQPTDDDAQWPSWSHARLFSVQVVGASDTGALECVPCAAGLHADAAGVECLPCPAGTTSDPTSVAATCSQCPENTMAPRPGSSECYFCGSGTDSGRQEGSRFCATPCEFSLLSSTGVVNSFDLTPLSHALRRVSAPIDSFDRTIYVSVCDRSVANATCGIDTYACAISQDSGDIIDLGSVPARSIETDALGERHLLLTFQHGDACAAEPSRHMQVMIRLYCDPEAASGLTVVYDGRTTDQDSCVIELAWRSPQACRVCEANEVDEVQSVCQNGKRRRRYQPLPGLMCRVGPQHQDQDVVCTDVQLPLRVAVGASIVLFVVVLAMVIFAVKFTRLRTRYEALSTGPAATSPGATGSPTAHNVGYDMDQL